MVLWKGLSNVGDHFVEVDPGLPIGRVLGQVQNSLFVVECNGGKCKGIDNRSRLGVAAVYCSKVNHCLPVDLSSTT